MEKEKPNPRQRLSDEAKSKSIVDVAETFGMDLHKTGTTYKGKWNGHDSFIINPRVNMFYWNGQAFGGSSIDLVSVLKYGATTKEDLKTHYRKSVIDLSKEKLETFDVSKLPAPKNFRYYLKDFPNIDLSREYLKNERGLSNETIDFFYKQGLMSESTRTITDAEGQSLSEPVIVFKYLDTNNKVIGGSIQGIESHPDWEGHEHKSGRIKLGMKGAGSFTGLKLTLGIPKRVISCEAPIDLMSYYELHKDELRDVILVASDGYKPESILRALSEVIVSSPLANVEQTKDKEYAIKHLLTHPEQLRRNYQNYITLSEKVSGEIVFAYDNDTAGHKFVERFKESYPDMLSKISIDFPPLSEGQEKSDWNDELKIQKGLMDRPQSVEEKKNIEVIMDRYSKKENDQAKTPEKENTTPAQSKFIKQSIERFDENGKSYMSSKIYELLDLTDFSQIKADRNGRVTLEAVGVLSIENKKTSFQEARLSPDKTLIRSRYVLSINVPQVQLSKPNLDEMRLYRQAKNGIEIQTPKQRKERKRQPRKGKNLSLEQLLKARNAEGLQTFLDDKRSSYKTESQFKKFLDVLTFMPDQSEKNIRLLLAQNTNIKQVADFNTWSEVHKRRIQAKSQSLKIFVPNPQPLVDKQENMVKDKKGQIQLSKVSESLISVFDVSQTSGSPVKGLEVSNEISRERAVELFQKLSSLSPVPIHFTEQVLEKEDKPFHFAHAWFNAKDSEIVIEKGLSAKEALETLTQEVIYQQFRNQEPAITQMEVEALCYVQLRKLGLETKLEISENLTQMSDSKIQDLLQNIQQGHQSFSKKVDELIKAPTKKSIDNMTLQEKLENARTRQAELAQENDASKKVQGAEVRPAPQI